MGENWVDNFWAFFSMKNDLFSFYFWNSEGVRALKIVVFENLYDALSPIIPKNWGLTLFWYIFGPKTAKKEQTFMRHSSFGSGWIFYFISKINYFRPFLWPVFFSDCKIAIQRWAKLKTLGCHTPLFYLLKKKSARAELEPTLPYATSWCYTLYQLSHQDWWTVGGNFERMNKKKNSCS